MTTRQATCHCGQLRLDAAGEPFHVSICSCEACQRRTGSAFGMQAAYRPDRIAVHGEEREWTRISDEADRRPHVFHFCPTCGSTVYMTEPDEPDLVVVAVGAFADPAFPPPSEAGYDARRHPWIGLPEGISRPGIDLWAPAKPLYEAGRFDEAAALGRAILAEHPDEGGVAYNVACCECLAGRPGEALPFLEQAIAWWDGFRDLARRDTDLDALRDDPRFGELVG